MQERTLNHVDPDPDSRIPRTLNHVDNRVSCWQATERMWTLSHVNYSERRLTQPHSPLRVIPI